MNLVAVGLLALVSLFDTKPEPRPLTVRADAARAIAVVVHDLDRRGVEIHEVQLEPRAASFRVTVDGNVYVVAKAGVELRTRR